LLVGSLLLGKVEEGRGECSGGGVVDRSGGEWTRDACFLPGKVEKGWNGGEVGEKCVAGISGLNVNSARYISGEEDVTVTSLGT
nr:hypothetical protein [Tanacetum cinerariifolium]